MSNKLVYIFMYFFVLYRLLFFFFLICIKIISFLLLTQPQHKTFNMLIYINYNIEFQKFSDLEQTVGMNLSSAIGTKAMLLIYQLTFISCINVKIAFFSLGWMSRPVKRFWK